MKKIDITKLKEFENHPYQVKDDAEMEALIESIKEHGILSPIIVRPLENDEYEIISGHRRLFASKRAGLTKVPALVVEMDRDSAAIALVDSNLHRENILPSEKAFAFKLKMEAMNRQGHRSDLTSVQVAPKLSTEIIGDNENISKDTVKRYIRLTHLLPKLLEYVDEGKIAFTPAVEISYLNDIEQQDLIEAIESEDCTPSLSQAVRMKKLSQEGTLDDAKILEIMTEEKANQKEMFKIPMERIQKFVPNASKKQIDDFVLKACEHYQKFLLRKKEKER